MKTWKTVLVLLTLCLWAGWPGPHTARAESDRGGGVRRSILQGTWYPADPGALRAWIQTRLSEVRPPEVQGRIRALVVPHAGYQYSGSVAARAYRLIQGLPLRRVVLIGPSHRWGFNGVSVSRHEAYETPLGRVPVDRETAERLMASSPDVRFVPRAHALEHSLEIQLPFLQSVLDSFRIVPVIMGSQDRATCSALARGLARVLDGSKDTLIVASTDLSHFHDHETAQRLDRVFERCVASFDPEGLAEALEAGRCEACGGGATVTALTAARMLGAGRSVILARADSGDVTGDRTQVVGYLAAAVLE